MNRCIICGAPIKNNLGLYCSDCLYEIKRVRLADEESLEDYIERMREKKIERIYGENLTSLERWLKDEY